jgi:hypothetical protein
MLLSDRLGLGGKKEDYKVKQAHVELKQECRSVTPGHSPNGDRVPYVIITEPRERRTSKRRKIRILRP